MEKEETSQDNKAPKPAFLRRQLLRTFSGNKGGRLLNLDKLPSKKVSLFASWTAEKYTNREENFREIQTKVNLTPTLLKFNENYMKAENSTGKILLKDNFMELN